MIRKLLLLSNLALVRSETEDAFRGAVYSDLCPPIHSHWLLPHEYDCTKFYYCEYGMKWETPRSCSPGTEFSYEEQICDWPQNVNCTSSRSTTSDPPTVAPTTPTTAAPSTDPPEPLPNGCPKDIHIHWLLPHETECNLFYYCNFGELVLRECAPGTYFNPEIQVCDWPQNVNCTSSGSTTPTPPTGAPTTQPTTAAPITPPPELLPNGCPNDVYRDWLLPHETECDLFYSCNFGELVLRECAPGTYFNPEMQICDWPQNVNCTSSRSTTSNPPTVAPTTPTTAAPSTAAPELLPNGCPKDIHIHWQLPHETECNLFYYCNFGELVLRECAPGTYFNPEIQVCDWPENVDCVSGGDNGGGDDGSGDNGSGGDGENGGDICERNCNIGPWAHETECNKFWLCVGQKTTLGVCPEGLNFNPSPRTCDLEGRVQCDQSTEIPN